MRKRSLKWKLTLLYTLLMTLLTSLVLAVLLSLGSGQLLASTQAMLRERVLESFELLKVRNGDLSVDSDFSVAEGGIYLSAYDESGALLAGKVPYGFVSSIAYQEDTVQTAVLNGSRWYVFDSTSQIRGYGPIRIRGVCSVSSVEDEMNTLVHLAVILLPLTVILSAVLCYSLVRRTLRPVFRITQTAKEICEQRDLSRRIGLSGGRDEISKLAETFDTMLDQLQAAFEQQKQFTSDVSHELRTPMAVILSQCDYLLADPNLSDKEREAIGTIWDRAKSLTRLISQLLLLSRADQNRQMLTLEPIDFSLLTRSVLEEQELLAGEKDITLEMEIPEHVMITGDETMLMRLWMNLVENAISYTPNGGRVTAGFYQKENCVVGYVKDTGIGIAPEELPRIWERFYRVDTARSDSAHSGLGLSMAKWIVQAHGGTLRAESTQGNGSTFLFTLPAAADPGTENESKANCGCNRETGNSN